MAVSKNFWDKVCDITECPICCGTFTNPRVLPCIHTFCLECVGRYGEGKQAGEKMTCPLCRDVFKVPLGGFSSLPKNYFIEKLLEAQFSSNNGSSKACDVCTSARETDMTIEVHAAIKFCVECHENMCKQCSLKHSNMKISKLHQLVTLDSLGNDGHTTESRKVACDQHMGEELKIYCSDCKQVGCLMCFVQQHSSHKCERC